MAGSEASSCSNLTEFNNFIDYIELLRNETDFQQQKILGCKKQICSALWGVGNPDISGIGVRRLPGTKVEPPVTATNRDQATTGFFLEVIIGFGLSVLILATKQSQPGHEASDSYGDRLRKYAVLGLQTYFDCAIYFSIAIEIAATVMLARKDFSVTQDDFGALDTQVVLAISVVCMLSLLHQMATARISTTEEATPGRKRPDSFLLLVATLLFFYPFISQCIRNWAPSRIGKGRGEGGTTIVTRSEWALVEATCFPVAQPLSEREQLIISALELLGSLLIMLTAGWIIIKAVPISREKEEERGLWRLGRRSWYHILDLSEKIWGGETLLSQVTFIALPLMLAVPLLWGIVRLRQAQSQLAETTEASYIGDEWGFGQVVSIVIFAPVFVEVGHLFLDS